MMKNNVKKAKKSVNCRQLIALLAVFFLCAQLSAHTGMLWGEKNLRVAKTKWFDIIYPERCEQSAAVLYEKADQIYDEVTAQYGLTPSFRFPVVITPKVQMYNAFWTSSPYNRIVIYDTGFSGSDELAVFSESFASLFRHELTHAVTYNMKNGFWRGIGVVLGDVIAPGMLSVTSGMAEGATVTSESASGEGRLNSEYAKQSVKQAKIEDKFPAYHDVSGASDVSPSGNAYFFNGAFHKWLQDNFGMEPYAEFWYRVVNGKNITIGGAFKKAYGLKLKTAWKQFVADYKVPDVAENPVEAGLVQDFFEPYENEYSKLNNAGSLYDSLSVAGDRLVWMDQYGGRVFVSDERGYRKLLSMRGLYDVKLSNDGRFVTLNYYSENAVAYVARVKLYDFESKSSFYIKDTGIKEAVVVKNGGGWYLVGQKYFNQHYSIAVYKLVLSDDGRRVTGCEPVNEEVLGVETNPYAFTPLADGTFAWLKKAGLSYSLCVSSIDGALLSETAFPAGTMVTSLSCSGDTFYFSYAQKGTMPRLGTLSGGKLSLSSLDLSGGVYEPVIWNDKIVYIGKFYRQNRILSMKDVPSVSAYENEIADAATPVAVSVSASDSDSDKEMVSEAFTGKLSTKPYNPFSYLFRGLLLPYTSYTSDSFGPNADYATWLDTAFLGLSYVTANPWTDGASDLITLTGGWNPLSNAFGTELDIIAGTSTSLLSTQTTLKSEFDSKGWKQSSGRFAASTAFRVGDISTLAFSNEVNASFGRVNKKIDVTWMEMFRYNPFNFWDREVLGCTAPETNEVFYSLFDEAQVQFSTIRKGGPGRFENRGIAFAVAYGQRYDALLKNPDDIYVKTWGVGAAARVCIPQLLPFESKYGFTYNLPVTLNATLLPSSSIYGYTSFGMDETAEIPAYRTLEQVKPGRAIFDATIEATAFSIDIQKAIPFFTAIYLNDFYVNCGYAATGTAGSATENGFQTAKLGDYFKAIGDGRGYYLDSVYLKFGLEFSPNIGNFASSSNKMGIYAVYSYTLNSVRPLNPTERVKLSLGFGIN